MKVGTPIAIVRTRRSSAQARRTLIAVLMTATTASIPAYVAQGQTVKLLHFAEPSAGNADDYAHTVAVTAIDEPRLTYNSRLLVIGAAAPPSVPPTNSAAMPLWLRTGSPSSSGIAVRTPALGMPCAPLPYRPRRDLALVTEARRARLFPLVAQAACEAGLPVGLFDALIVQESRYNMSVISPKGAIGLSQLMPGTARYLSVANPFDAQSNLRGGARYLREQLTAFGRVDLALAAYNAGPGRVRSRWAVPRIAETRDYVTSVTRRWHIGTAREAALLDFRRPATPLRLFLPPPPQRVAQLVLFDGER